jgi:hypothetical protein
LYDRSVAPETKKNGVNTIVLVAHGLVIFGLAFFLVRRQPADLRPLFWWGLAARAAAGLALGLVYLDYYGAGDTLSLFQQAKEQAALFPHNSRAYWDFLTGGSDPEWKGQARSMFFIRMISIVAVFTQGNYWTTALWLSFLSFLAAWYFFRVLLDCFTGARTAAAIAILFFPSVIFWSSGIIKETPAMAGLLITSGVFVKMMMKRRVTVLELILTAGGIIVLWNLKYYWAAVFFPITTSALIVAKGVSRWPLPDQGALALYAILCGGLFFIPGLLHPNFSVGNFLPLVVDNNRAFSSLSAPENLIHYQQLMPTWSSMALNTPWAIVSGLFRPFIWEAGSLWKVVTSFENLAVFILTLSSLYHLRDFKKSTPLLLASTILYVVILCTFLALSTPNLGTLSRYKVAFVPFLVFLLAYKNPLVESLVMMVAGKRKPEM